MVTVVRTITPAIITALIWHAIFVLIEEVWKVIFDIYNIFFGSLTEIPQIIKAFI
jgi:hypothetical protein